MKFLAENDPQHITVWENGKLAEDIFIRVFADGSTVLQDLTDSYAPRRLTLHRKIQNAILNCPEEEVMSFRHGKY